MTRRRIPRWVHRLPPGCFRSYLATVFLGPSRSMRRQTPLW